MDHQTGALVGHRIAVDTLLRMVLIDLYAKVPDGADAFERMANDIVTALHGVSPAAQGQVTSEFIKQHALHSIEGLVGGIAPAIREKLGQPKQQPM